jgi:hypothetical protein
MIDPKDMTAWLEMVVQPEEPTANKNFAEFIDELKAAG